MSYCDCYFCLFILLSCFFSKTIKRCFNRTFFLIIQCVLKCSRPSGFKFLWRVTAHRQTCVYSFIYVFIILKELKVQQWVCQILESAFEVSIDIERKLQDSSENLQIGRKNPEMTSISSTAASALPQVTRSVPFCDMYMCYASLSVIPWCMQSVSMPSKDAASLWCEAVCE